MIKLNLNIILAFIILMAIAIVGWMHPFGDKKDVKQDTVIHTVHKLTVEDSNRIVTKARKGYVKLEYGDTVIDVTDYYKALYDLGIDINLPKEDCLDVVIDTTALYVPTRTIDTTFTYTAKSDSFTAVFKNRVRSGYHYPPFDSMYTQQIMDTVRVDLHIPPAAKVVWFMDWDNGDFYKMTIAAILGALIVK